VAEEISFVGGSQNCCVCFIDIVDSTRITTVDIAGSEKIKIYYSVFINTMAAIVRNFDGTIIKNTGDSLIYYFPKTMGHVTGHVTDGNVTNIKNVFECGLTMLAVHPIMNVKLKEKGLPDLSYRISADYGKVEVANSLTSTS
jgi:class 3 adenylate cyclase